MFALRFTPLLAAALLAGCATPAADTALPGAPPLPKLDPAQQRGYDIAVRRCSGCHTVGLDEGGAGDGPSFRRLSARYNPISLQRRFVEVSQHGFDRMPPVSITSSEAEDLVAYFDTLQGR